MTQADPPLDAEEAVKIITGKMVPFEDDPLMLDASEELFILNMPPNWLPGTGITHASGKNRFFIAITAGRI